MSKFEIAVRLYKTYLIAEALKRFNGNQTKAARDLGLHRNTLRRSMAIFGIKVDQHRPPQRVHQPTPIAVAALENQHNQRRG